MAKEEIQPRPMKEPALDRSAWVVLYVGRTHMVPRLQGGMPNEKTAKNVADGFRRGGFEVLLVCQVGNLLDTMAE